MSERTLLKAIAVITEETGYPPTPEELAEACGISTRSLHLRLRPAKHAGRVRYDEAERYTLAAQPEGAPDDR